jgi:GNAT superfamily N-acetyltransferase
LEWSQIIVSEVRLLSEADIPAGMRLKEAAGWNQTAADWQRVLVLEPEGCFAIECDGQVRATTTAVCFGKELAWVGMVLTDAQYRGRGFARRLMEHALAYLRGKHVAWIKLDATDMGRPLYERLGFHEEGAIERWFRPAGAVPCRSGAVGPFELDAALDRRAFGADRSFLLQVLAGIESVSIARMGFAMGRPGAKAAFFGPCVAQSVDAARELAAWFLAKHGQESVYWDILPANGEAVALAREFGFEPVRKLARMALAGVEEPPAFANDDARVYAAAGFEFG